MKQFQNYIFIIIKLKQSKLIQHTTCSTKKHVRLKASTWQDYDVYACTTTKPMHACTRKKM